MSLKSKVLEYLEQEPKFRERKNKDRGLVNLLMKKYSGLEAAITTGIISKDSLIAMVQDYSSMDRSWRQALELDPRLRGSDYDEKETLMSRKMEELGYSVPPRRP